jgi:lipopolysaccharide transport system ATP-binding protein
MSDVRVRAEHLSKMFLLGGGEGEPVSASTLLRHYGPLLLGRKPADDGHQLWALKDVSFEVRAGEVIGIVGRNGSGKSTLLKILSRVTEPSSGSFSVVGRVGSLLEVGTGFHPDLTGRQNVFLNGSILGMSQAEIASRFDEIVAFAEVDRFIDTPVRHYSSGMYMRLAFSVAAHLEPEILLVDEVLAVGDAAFQKKCLGRMEELGGSGRTVLFVSHSMPSVLRLCPRVVLLDGGHVTADGNGSTVVEEYMGRGGGAAERVWPDATSAPGDDLVRLRSVRVLDAQGEVSPEIDIRQPVFVEVEYWNLSNDPGFRPTANIHFFNAEGTNLFISNDMNNPEWRTRTARKGLVRARCCIPGNFFAEGGVFVSAAVTSLGPTMVHCHEIDAVAFHVMDPSEGDGVRGDWVGDFPGVLRPMLQWETTIEQATP